MATEKPRFSVTFSDESFEKIQEYKKEQNLSTQSKAVAQLVALALDTLEESGDINTAPSLSDEAMKVARDYQGLDRWGRGMVREVIGHEQTRMEEEASLVKMSLPEKIVRFRVPEYSHPMSAGTGVEAELEFPNDLELVKAPPRGTSYVAHVTGNSMEPDFHDGDMVFVHAVEEIPVGRIGVFLMNGQQWVKELGHGVLISHNRDYDPITITDGTRCQGLVIGLCDSSYFEA